VVGNELEAAHRFVSPAEYFAATLRVDRLVDPWVDQADGHLEAA
jgi:hypothetical protein